MRGSAPSAALTVAFEGSARIQAGECHSHVCRCSVVVGNEWWRRWMEPKIHGVCSSSAPPATNVFICIRRFRSASMQFRDALT
jgi:hypothetical protein